MAAVSRLTLAFSLVALAVPAFAQRGGHAGFFSPGQYGAVASHGTGPLAGGRSFPIHSYGPAPLGLRAPAAGYTGIEPGGLRNWNYGRGGYAGFRHRDYRHVPFGYFFAPYYYPFLDYGDMGYEYPPEDYTEDPAAQAAYAQQNMLGEQVQQLSAEVEQLREQQAPPAPQAPPYSESTPPSPASTQNEEPPTPPITVVLRNGQQFQVKNYAIMDQTFWDFTRQPARKIPVSTIDIPASTRATEANGAEFPQIAGS